MAPKLRKRGSSVGAMKRTESFQLDHPPETTAVSQGSTPVGRALQPLTQGSTPVGRSLQRKPWLGAEDKPNDPSGPLSLATTLSVVVTPPEEGGWLSRSASFTTSQFPTPPSVPLRVPVRKRMQPPVVQLAVGDDLDAPFSIDANTGSPAQASAGPSTPCHVVHLVRSRRSSNASAAGSDVQGDVELIPPPRSRASSLSRSQSAILLTDRLEARNQLVAAEIQAKETAVALRASQLDPKASHARRWAEAIVLALSSKCWLDAHPAAINVIRRRARAEKVLRTRFLPCWRGYMARRKERAMTIVSNFILRWVAKLRIRKRRAAALIIIRFLKHPTQLLSRCAAGYRVRAVRLQRATRLLLLRRKAQVELQLLRLRGTDFDTIAPTGIEAEYWMQRAGRKCGFFDKAAWIANLSAKGSDAALELPRVPVTVLRRRLLEAVTAASRRYHLDNAAWEKESAFTSAQPRSSAKELRTVVGEGSPKRGSYNNNPLHSGRSHRDGGGAQLQTEDSFGRYFDSGTFDAPPPTSSRSGGGGLVKSTSGSGYVAMSQLSRMRRPVYKAFLSKEALFNALDEACRTTAVLRSDPRWTAHLQS